MAERRSRGSWFGILAGIALIILVLFIAGNWSEWRQRAREASRSEPAITEGSGVAVTWKKDQNVAGYNPESDGGPPFTCVIIDLTPAGFNFDCQDNLRFRWDPGETNRGRWWKEGDDRYKGEWELKRDPVHPDLFVGRLWDRKGTPGNLTMRLDNRIRVRGGIQL
jgi:hypothetical protein